MRPGDRVASDRDAWVQPALFHGLPVGAVFMRYGQPEVLWVKIRPGVAALEGEPVSRLNRVRMRTAERIVPWEGLNG